MRWIYLSLLFATACGRFGFDATGGGADAGRTGDAQEGADAQLTNTIWDQMFSEPVLWEHGDVAYNASPSLTADGRHLFYVSSLGDAFTDNDVYTSNFDGANWSPPMLVTELAFDGPALGVAVSSDGLTIWTTRDGVSTGTDVWVSTRATFAEAWSVPQLADDPNDSLGLNSPADDHTPSVFADGLECFFASRRDGGAGDLDVWHATRASTASPWSNATQVSALSTGAIEDAPWISPDGMHLVFMSNRQPNNTGNGNDSNFYYTARVSATEFSSLIRLDDINSPPELGVGRTWDEDFSASADGKITVFSSNRSDDAVGTLFVANR